MPFAPGVYWYKNKKNSVIYIGKSAHLRVRLQSYARINEENSKTFTMLSQSVSVNWLSVVSDFDALILEAKLIKLHQPKYNAILKDDKAMIYLVVRDQEYPSVIQTRQLKAKSRYQSMFGPFPSSYQAKKLLITLRRIFPWCETGPTGQACFYYHLEQCPGVCLHKAKYDHDNLQHLKNVLSGQRQKVIHLLTTELERAIDVKDFETAAKLKIQINNLRTIHLSRVKQDEPPIPQLEVDHTTHQLTVVAGLLKQIGLAPPQYRLTRIECYDISNLQGTLATGSMIVFTDGVPDQRKYRHFRIKSQVQGDVHMMAEVLERRKKHPEWASPNLIVVDGGAAQVRLASSLFSKIPVIGIAKRPYPKIVYLRNNKPSFHALKPSDPATTFLMSLISESHRFARRYHHFLHKKQVHPS